MFMMKKSKYVKNLRKWIGGRILSFNKQTIILYTLFSYLLLFFSYREIYKLTINSTHITFYFITSLTTSNYTEIITKTLLLQILLGKILANNFRYY